MLERFMSSVSPACITKRIHKKSLPLYDFKCSLGRIRCCNLKKLGFGFCSVGQKIGKKSTPETDHCFYVEGLEKKIPI